jgi:hypothetical protein
LIAARVAHTLPRIRTAARSSPENETVLPGLLLGIGAGYTSGTQ